MHFKEAFAFLVSENGDVGENESNVVGGGRSFQALAIFPYQH